MLWFSMDGGKDEEWMDDGESRHPPGSTENPAGLWVLLGWVDDHCPKLFSYLYTVSCILHPSLLLLRNEKYLYMYKYLYNDTGTSDSSSTGLCYSHQK